MAGMIVGALGFGKDAFQYGLRLCLARAGLTAYRVDSRTAGACDVLLVSLFWWRDLLLLEAFLRKSGIRRGGKPFILAGGIQATLCPEIVAEMADAVFVGDADDHLGEILDTLERGARPESPFLYRSGDPITPTPAVCAPSAFACQTQEDGGTTRIEIARGCKFNCAFCAISQLKPYAEVPFTSLQPLLDAAPSGKVSCFAPERTYHTDWPRLKAYLAGNPRLRDLGTDVRLEHMGEIDTHSVSTGIEGISARLRKSIGKPRSAKAIMTALEAFIAKQRAIARVALYFIADLPGESTEDWQELRELFSDISRAEWSRYLTAIPVLNPLSPKPMTALADAVIHPLRDYAAQWQAVLRPDGGRWGFRIKETLVWGPTDRVLDVIVTRGGAQAYPLIRRLPARLLSHRPPGKDDATTARAILASAEKLGLGSETLRIG